MLPLDMVGSLYDALDMFDTEDALISAVSAICKQANFTFFAISHHVDFAREHADFLHIHNYPIGLAGFHDSRSLGIRDPVHRASQLRGSGFLWSALPHLLHQLTPEDQMILERADAAGIGPGYTRPFHVPGERSGSSSFAVKKGATFPRNLIAVAEALGAFAFETGRSLTRRRDPTWIRDGWLTDRERQIVTLLGHGKSEKQIARNLAISPLTVNDHLRRARSALWRSQELPLGRVRVFNRIDQL